MKVHAYVQEGMWAEFRLHPSSARWRVEGWHKTLRPQCLLTTRQMNQCVKYFRGRLTGMPGVWKPSTVK